MWLFDKELQGYRGWRASCEQAQFRATMASKVDAFSPDRCFLGRTTAAS
jgi:hypothetical protein